MSGSLSRLAVALLTAFGVLSVLAVALGLINVAHANAIPTAVGGSQQVGIAVCGHGTSKVKPDRATLHVGVYVNAGTAQAARDQAADAMKSVIDALKANGVKAEDIQTGYVSINPTYDYSNGRQSVTGYAAANSVTAVIHNVDAVGTVLDAATRAGGNVITVNGVSFSNEDPNAAANDARKQALADAKVQATRIADAAGVTLGAPISIQVDGCGASSPVPIYAGAANAKAADSTTTTPIEPGQTTTAASVAVVYSIR